MLNCCLAEQNRRRSTTEDSTSTSPQRPSAQTKESPTPCSPPSTHSSTDSQNLHALDQDSGSASVSGFDKDERTVRAMSTAESPVPGTSRHSPGKKEAASAVGRRDGDVSVVGGGGDMGLSSPDGSPKSPRRKSARLKAKFASERDAILRRVGVRKQSRPSSNSAKNLTAMATPTAPASAGRSNSKESTRNSAPAPGTLAASEAGDNAGGKRARRSGGRWRRARVHRQPEPVPPSPVVDYADELPPSPKPRGLMEELSRNKRGSGSYPARSSRFTDPHPDAAGVGVGSRGPGSSVHEKSVEQEDGSFGRDDGAENVSGGAGNGGKGVEVGLRGEVGDGVAGKRGKRVMEGARGGARFTGGRLLVTGER